MNPIWAAVLILSLISPVMAYSGTEVSTNSFLISSGSDISALRSITQNQISTPDLHLLTGATITSSAITEDGGLAQISQNALFSASSDIYGQYTGLAAINSQVSAIGTKKIESGISLNGVSILSNPWGDMDAMSKVQAECFGVTFASPGTDNYGLSVDASQNTYANGLILKNSGASQTDANRYSISFAPDAIEFEEPADSIDENINLQCTYSEDSLESYTYDFSRDIKTDDVEFIGKMVYGRWGGV